MPSAYLAAMVATHRREQLLLQRALPSIFVQSRPVDSLVVIDDAANSELASDLAALSPDAQLLPNRRTKGLSGALNTGLDHLARQVADPSRVFVAFLDDDDAWMPNHAEQVQAFIQSGAQVIATPFMRLETGRQPHRIDPPTIIRPEMFMAGNPGIQGSNLTVRLDILLEAGGFNEALQSCTDRDLLIRLSRRADLTYAAAPSPSVTHHACTDRERLSRPDSQAKRAGLDMFDRIHGPTMDQETRSAHLARAERLFSWRPTDPPRPSSPAVRPARKAEIPPLVVGIIVDDRRVPSASRLLDDLAALIERERLDPPEVLLLENRPQMVASEPLLRMVQARRTSLRLRVVSRADLSALEAEGVWRPEGSEPAGRLTIADARTALQICLHHLAKARPGCAVWILDDDMRLDPLIEREGIARPEPLQLGDALARMRATGAEICIGAYTGAPPLPAIASLRGQLVDVLWNLRRLSVLPAGAPVPMDPGRNAALRAGRRDYYHDLSRIETDRQETPFALEPAHPEETCGEALSRLAGLIPRILAGEAPLRPLTLDASDMAAFATGEALHRGGNTFIFDPEALADLSNAAPRVEGRATRRSDMIWSLLQARRCGRRVISVPVPVRHDRSDLPAPDTLDPTAIIDDIRGFAAFSALADCRDAPELIEPLCAKYEQERLAALRLSFFRLRGLAAELASWTRLEAPSHAPREALADHAQHLLTLYSAERFEEIATGVQKLGRPEIHAFLETLDARIRDFSDRVRRSEAVPLLLAGQRAEAALAAISGHAGDPVGLHLLGQGGEGVVATDGRACWKLFDRWTSAQEARAVPVLERLIRDGVTGDALQPPTRLTCTPVGWLLETQFESSTPYRGGFGPGLVELLSDLLRNGLACRNLHPKNLRVVGDAVRLIDLGADLIALDDPEASSPEVRRMCRRAWLSWRWWWREDLNLLMCRSIHEADLPELSGHDALIRAVQERLGIGIPPDPTLLRATALRPKRLLDYGAGKGKEAAALARSGADVIAWDPDPAVAARLDALAEHGVRRAASASEAVAAGPFDLVVCRRVACLLDDAALDVMIKDLRAAVSPQGRVLLTLCHPAYAHRAHVAEAAPLSAPCGCASAPWTKRIRATGRVLHEVHRSERLLRRRLARAGLRVTAREERSCTEFERFETVADLLVLELAPMPRPEVSLLIKACAMDAEALEVHVRDMLDALEGPGAFHETILALDTRTEGFPRAHAAADLPALREAAEHLRATGEIDRIVETPNPEALPSLNRRWFGLDLAASHSAGGAATGALLAGFEGCTTRRVLHADLDMMIGRYETDGDPVAELSDALDACPDAVTASFPVAREGRRAWTATGPDGPWRVESRLGMVDMDRMGALLPLPNEGEGGAPKLSWHRAMDEAVQQGRGTSLRGGGGAFCIHPPNHRKPDLDAWEEVRSAIARGRAPAVQHDRIEWTGGLADWRQPERRERFVFVICGRNVMPERFRRCWASVLAQGRDDWGAVVIDDASAPWVAEEIGRILAPFADRVSFIVRRRRMGLLANTAFAIRHLCAAPEQVIVTLDADDHLIGAQALDRIATEYARGADLTVGSMLRTDKRADYPVRFEAPRRHRGGNVWQHLRSFRKELFDAVPDEMLHLDDAYVELASDWAFMLPMVELARRPVWIREPLYLHEPGEARDPARAAAREAVIARLIARSMPCTEDVR